MPMENLMYAYALNEAKEVVHIKDVTEEMKESTRFFCISCGDEMIACLGEVNQHYFRHKNTSTCNKETYLHKLGKRIIRERFYNNPEFLIELSQYEKCAKEDCPLVYKNCTQHVRTTVNLKDFYNVCEEEHGCENFVADLLLYSDSRHIEPIMLEVCVTHKCTQEKIDSGLRIIEFFLKDEDDAFRLYDIELKEEADIIQFYNFKKEKLSNKILNNDVMGCVLYPNGRTEIFSFKYGWTCRSLEIKDDDELNDVLLKISTMQYCDNLDLFLLQRANAMGANIKNCKVCKFYKKNEYKGGHICVLYKKCGTPKEPDENEGNKCRYYKYEYPSDELVESPDLYYLSASPNIKRRQNIALRTSL